MSQAPNQHRQRTFTLSLFLERVSYSVHETLVTPKSGRRYVDARIDYAGIHSTIGIAIKANLTNVRDAKPRVLISSEKP